MAKVNETSDVQNVTDRATDGDSAQPRIIDIPNRVSVRHLAEIIPATPVAIIKQLMRNGIMANINQVIDYKTAAEIIGSFGYQAHLKPGKTEGLSPEAKKRQRIAVETSGPLQIRPPIVTVMGHVNHGKTRLLDTIRKTKVMDSEAGHITQHIGAYQVEVNGKRISFLDTPGHEAFTAMRARGAQVTDITVLVVAADDGVMPQTLEAIDHARAAGVPIVVAINKIDKDNANPELVKQQLADAGLLIEEWGGDVICVPISAKEQIGIPELLENILLLAEMENLQVNPAEMPFGIVIEAGLDKSRGPLATVLVQRGTLRLGDTIVVGTTWGRVKAMFNYSGKRVRKAEPSTPVQILGPDNVPKVGDVLTVAGSEHQARALVQQHQSDMAAELAMSGRSMNLSNIYDQVSKGHVKELNIILKVDVQGSIEPIRNSLEQLSNKEVQVKVIHSGTGNVTESDVMLAIASKGLIIGFNTSSEQGAKRMADMENISIRYYDVIYSLADDVSKALKGMLEPVFVEVIFGRAEVRAVFPGRKKHKVAGVYVTDGKINAGASVRVKRGDQIISETTANSIRRFKDDVKEVSSGFECGVELKDYYEFQTSDMLEFFRIEKHQ